MEYKTAYDAVIAMPKMSATELKELRAYAAKQLQVARDEHQQLDEIGWTAVRDICERRLKMTEN